LLDEVAVYAQPLDSNGFLRSGQTLALRLADALRYQAEDVDRLAAMNGDLVLRLAGRGQQLEGVYRSLMALADTVGATVRAGGRAAGQEQADLVQLLREGVAAIMADGVRVDSAAWLWRKRVLETLGDG
jgi:hypothetical protein